LDPLSLRNLAEETSIQVAETFAANYAGLLPQRVERIVRSVGIGDRAMAMDASLSLRTSSSMAGALRMSRLCRDLEQALVAADAVSAAAAAREITIHLPGLQEALAASPPIR
jgi:hypothetical protein